MQQLDDPEFITEQWLTEQDVITVKEELKGQMDQYKAEATEYIAYKLRERQEAMIQINWLAVEIERLSWLANWYDKKVTSVEKRIDYIMQTFSIEKMDTPLNKLSYRESSSLVIVDESLVPDEFKEKVVTETIKIDKNTLKAYIKKSSDLPVPGVRLVIKQNLQIK